MRHLATILTVLLLSGCTLYTLVEPGEVTVDGAYTFKTTTSWSRGKAHSNASFLTKDGVTLQQLMFTDKLSEGDKLFAGVQGKTMPAYATSMNLIEVRDFVRESILALNVSSVDETAFSPSKFGPWQGFRGEYVMTSNDGLRMQALVVGTQKDGKLYAMVFWAPSLFYYDKYIQEVEEIINSVSAIGDA